MAKTKPKAKPVSIRARVEALINAIEQPLAYGHERWQDESQYEDIKDYIVLYQTKANELGWKVIRMTKSPYGFRAIHEKDRIELKLSLRGDQITWKARPLGVTHG